MHWTQFITPYVAVYINLIHNASCSVYRLSSCALFCGQILGVQTHIGSTPRLEVGLMQAEFCCIFAICPTSFRLLISAGIPPSLLRLWSSLSSVLSSPLTPPFFSTRQFCCCRPPDIRLTFYYPEISLQSPFVGSGYRVEWAPSTSRR